MLTFYMSNFATGHGCIMTTILQKMVTVDKIFAYLDTHVVPPNVIFGEEYLLYFQVKIFHIFFHVKYVE